MAAETPMTSVLNPMLWNMIPLTVADRVATVLREAILSGRIKPGERLVERRLAEEFGVSLASLRTALQQIEREGLVTKKANTATHVTKLSREKLREMLDVRMLLEPAAMLLASQNLTLETDRQLQNCADEIDRAVSVNDFYGVARADLHFHQSIWSICGNETMIKMLNQLCVPVFAFLMILMSLQQEQLKNRVTSHQDLLDLIRSKDSEKIRGAIRAHIMTSWHPFLDELK